MSYPDEPTGTCGHGTYGPACPTCNPRCEHGVSASNTYDPCVVCASAESAQDEAAQLRRENEELRAENARLRRAVESAKGATGALKHVRG